MKLALALMFQNSAPWLRLHLPVIARAFDGIVAVDGGSSDDGADVIRQHGGVVFDRAFDWDFGAQGNYLIECCERLGYEAMLRLDPDELIYPSIVPCLRARLEVPMIVSLPRFNFTADRLHINLQWYPDPQQRAWRLGCGVRYKGLIHEIPVGQPSLVIPGMHIYHYGWISEPAELIDKQRHYHALSNLPFDPGPVFEYPAGTLFTQGEQPLDPKVIGVRAPYV